MADSLGTARLDLVVDTSEFEASVNRASTKLDGLGNEAAKAFQQSDDKAKRAAVSLARYIELMGKGADETRLLQAAFRGIDPNVLRELEQRMASTRASIDQARRAAEELEATRAFEAQAREAAKLVKASEYVRFWEDALEDADRAQQQLAAKNNFLNSLQAQAVAIGKTRSELLELKAAEMGVSAEAAPFIAKLREQEQQLIRSGAALNKYGLNAKQVELALRGVPAQLTDITVSLAGGQNPFMVLLQQGGQLRDMFGGIRPAIGALGGAVAGLVTPVNVLGAAIAAVVVAGYQGSEEQYAFARAIAQTGDATGITINQLENLRGELAVGITTQGEAAAALAEVAKSGKFTADQIGLVTQAAIAMQQGTGQSIETTVAQFAKLAESPVQAVAALNKETHFLTETIYQQIRALEEQGRTQEAAALAMEAYAKSVNERMAEVKQNIGLLQKAWLNLKTGALAAWDAMMGIGRQESTNERLTQLYDDLDKLKNSNFAYIQYGRVGSDQRKEAIRKKQEEVRAIIRAEVAENRKAYLAAATQDANDYAIAQEATIAAHGSADQKRAREIARSRKESDVKAKKALEAGNADLAATIRENQRKYEAALNAEGAKKTKSNAGAMRALARADMRLDLQGLKDDLATERDAIANSRRVTEAEYAAKLISMEEYYRRSRKAVQDDVAAQESSLTAQIAALKSRDMAGKDAIDITRQITTLEHQLAKVRADGATALSVLSVQEQDAVRQRELAFQAYKDGLNEITLGIERDYDAQIKRITLGKTAYEMEIAMAQVYEKTRLALKALNEERDRGSISPEEYARRKKAVEDSEAANIEAVRRGRAEMEAEQKNWLNGVSTGIQDWIDQQSNVADALHNITTQSLDRTADALADFVMTGKLQWKELLRSILADILKFMAKQIVMQFLQSFAGAWGGGAGGVTTTSTGAAFANYAAKGAYFDKGQANFFAKGAAFATNNILTQATPFLFGKGGQFGIAGEAGPEAIMPLKRGPNGALGVQVYGGGSGSAVNVNVTTIVNSDGSKSTETTGSATDAAMQQFSKEMAAIANQQIDRSMMPNGSLWKAGVRIG